MTKLSVEFVGQFAEGLLLSDLRPTTIVANLVERNEAGEVARPPKLHITFNCSVKGQYGLGVLEIDDAMLCQILWLRLTVGGLDQQSVLSNVLNNLSLEGDNEDSPKRIQYLSMSYKRLIDLLNPPLATGKPDDQYDQGLTDTNAQLSSSELLQDGND